MPELGNPSLSLDPERTQMSHTKYDPDMCLRCGEQYQPNSPRQLYCTPRCRRAHNRPRSETRTMPEGTLCRYRECRQPVTRSPGSRGPLPSFCTDTCRRRERSAREAEMSPSSEGGASRLDRSARRKYATGDVFGELTLVEYTDPTPGGDSRARFSCSCGSSKVLRLSNVTSGATTHCADRSQHRDPNYVPQINTAHARLRELRGPASQHPCVRCGLTGPGNQWSYRHSALDPLVQETGRDAGQVYSLDPADYWALCRSHHFTFDRAHGRLHVPAGQVSGIHHILALAYDPYGDTQHAAIASLDLPSTP